ncbi:hypothetical protein GWI33_015596 [Rhynchophorus ferrugineus]|uniref:Uncharacterized protein n=1 Tax=Rhynchophorus ferrugineus TaxID=354439 RepID=A0A834I332_RHYFE|nr:hypothetical protein GWI33_015596 [Rhynchophorus ferrugineus]
MNANGQNGSGSLGSRPDAAAMGPENLPVKSSECDRFSLASRNVRISLFGFRSDLDEMTLTSHQTCR